MKNYSYDYEWDIEYCYPDSNVLINKLNITNSDDLSVAEREITSVKLAYAKQHKIKGNFDLKHLQKIHKFLFEDIYSWAGKLRHVNIAKGNQFCLAQNLESYADNIFSKLKAENYLVDAPNVAERLAYYLSEINVLHPFREGNGRTQRLFIEYLALNAGYRVDFSDVTPEEMIIASAESFACDYEKINSMFKRITYSKKQELLDLGKEIEERRETIVQEWLKIHERPSRGIIEWEKQKALDTEAAQRYQEIIEKYK